MQIACSRAWNDSSRPDVARDASSSAAIYRIQTIRRTLGCRLDSLTCTGPVPTTNVQERCDFWGEFYGKKHGADAKNKRKKTRRGVALALPRWYVETWSSGAADTSRSAALMPSGSKSARWWPRVFCLFVFYRTAAPAATAAAAAINRVR